MALNDAFENLRKAAGDLSSLDVVSFTGKLKAEIYSKDEKNIIDWKLFAKEAKKEGVIKLKLASHYNYDGDATLFEEEGEIPDTLRTAHNEAVKAGQQIRKDLLDLFADTVRKLVTLL